MPACLSHPAVLACVRVTCCAHRVAAAVPDGTSPQQAAANTVGGWELAGAVPPSPLLKAPRTVTAAAATACDGWRVGARPWLALFFPSPASCVWAHRAGVRVPGGCGSGRRQRRRGPGGWPRGGPVPPQQTPSRATGGWSAAAAVVVVVVVCMPGCRPHGRMRGCPAADARLWTWVACAAGL